MQRPTPACAWQSIAAAMRNAETRKKIMTTDPDPFEPRQRAARENIPAEANPYQEGSEHHALWAAGHERIASAVEASEGEDS